MLAKLVSGRIGRDAEDILSLRSPLAADAISRSTTAQLKMLALQEYLFFTKHSAGLPERERAEIIFQGISPLTDVALGQIDMLHLMSLSCVAPLAFPSSSPAPQINAMFSDNQKTWDCPAKIR